MFRGTCVDNMFSLVYKRESVSLVTSGLPDQEG